MLSKPKPGRQGVSRVEIGSGNRLVASDTETFTYDVRDQLSARRDRRTGATTHYVYDSFDMLVRIETRGPDGAELEPAWQYSYDALGRRTEVRRGGYRRSFYWDGDRLAAEVMPNGALRVYEYAGHGALVPLAFTDYASADASPESGEHYTVFTDPVGQPLQIEDAKGQLVWFASRVDPYGHIEVHPASQLEYNLRWPGHYHDPETALHYNRYRYYDPALGRYLQTDPLGYEGSPTNLYGYPANPLTDVDVLGLAHPARDSRGRFARRGAAGNDGSEGARPPPRGRGDGDAGGPPRMSREEGQAVADTTHAALREQDRTQVTTTVSELSDGRVLVTSSDTTNGVTPAQREVARAELRSRGLSDDQILFQTERGNPGYDPPAQRNLTDAPVPGRENHGEQRGIQGGQNHDAPVVRQWASSDAAHGGAACDACEAAQRQHGVRNETGFQSQGGRFDQGGTDPPWNQ